MKIKAWDSSFINALEGKNQGHIPVWFMRQAGRYLPEYRELMAKHSFRERSHTPELMCEITVQPLRRFQMDAAIMFSDILTCLEFMGAAFDFTGEGPKLPKAGPDMLKNIKPLDTKDMSFVYQGISQIKEQIGTRPLIGFVGAPFTLLSYLIEGGTSREFFNTRKFLFERPKEFHATMEILADSVGRYLQAQKQAGVNAVQVFDSWVGFLSASTYEEMILPHMQHIMKLVNESNTPSILYSQPTPHLLNQLVKTGAKTISVDWRTDLREMAKLLDSQNQSISIQGNLDPVITALDWNEAKPYVNKILSQVKDFGLRNRYVFNVGHGVSPETKFETIGAIVDHVHQF